MARAASQRKPNGPLRACTVNKKSWTHLGAQNPAWQSAQPTPPQPQRLASTLFKPANPCVRFVEATHECSLGGGGRNARSSAPSPAPVVVLVDKVEGGRFPWRGDAAGDGQVAGLHVVLRVGRIQKGPNRPR